MKLQFSHTRQGKNVLQFHFQLIENENTEDEKFYFFHTYEDLSGFPLNYDITNPKDYIKIGVEIIEKYDYIRNKVKEAYKEHREKEKLLRKGERQ